MRKLIIVLASALALSSFAKMEKFFEVTVADSTKLVDAAAKIGGFVGEPMLGVMASGMISANPMVASLGIGPMRPGALSYLVVYVEDGKTEDEMIDDGMAVFLYPTQATKAECLAALEGSKEVDGAVRPAGAEDISLVFDDGAKYVAITGEDKEDIALAKKALASLPKMPRLGKNEILNARFTKFALKKFADMVEASEKELASSGAIKFQVSSVGEIKQIEALSVFAGVTQRGLDLGCRYRCREGSELSKLGTPMKNASPLAFAGKDALVAMAWGENSGTTDMAKYWEEFAKILKKWGFEPRGVKVVQEGGVVKFSVDVPAIVKYLKGDAQKSAAAFKENMDMARIHADLAGIAAKEKDLRSAKAGAAALYVKGVSVPMTAQERFAKLMPEYAAKPCLFAAVFSYYAMLKNCGLQVVEALEAGLEADADKATAAQIKSIFAAMPAADGVDMACVWNKKGNLHDCVLRISPAEFNGLYKLGMSAFTMAAFQSMNASQDLDDADFDEDGDGDGDGE